MENLFSDLWPFLLSALTGISGWIAASPKQRVELESSNLENAQKVIDMWRETTARLEEQLVKSDSIANSLKDEVVNLRNEVALLKKENAELKKLIKQLKEQTS